MREKTTKRGDPCGFVTIEDFEGSGELALFGLDWGRWNGMFTEGASLYITAKMQQRFRDSDTKQLKVQNIEYLQVVKEKAIDRITIQLNTDKLDDRIVAELGEIISEHPGKTKLFFQLRDSTGKHHVLLHSRNQMVDVKHHLIDYIERTEALDYKIN